MQTKIQPVITTIIPTYRRPFRLERAIRSVLSQSFDQFQVCIYDNASGDETADVVAKLREQDDRIKYFRHDQNIGGSRNFLFGMNRVDTPYFSFLSDDDVLLPWCYETALSGFDKYPDAIFSAGSYINVDERGKVLLTGIPEWTREGYFAPPEGFYEMLTIGLHWTSVLFRKDVIEEVGLVDPEVGAPIDVDLHLRIAARFPFVISGKPCSLFVRHSSSTSVAPNLDLYWPGLEKIILNLKNDQRIPPELRDHAENFLSHKNKMTIFHLGVNYIKQKSLEDALMTAAILSDHFNDRQKSGMIKAAVKMRKYLPPLYDLLFYLNLWRRLTFWRRERKLQNKYGSYARFLKP